MKLIFFFLLSAPAFSADVQWIQVSGKCELKVIPDRGSVRFTSENQSKNQAEAVKKTNAQINSLKDKIKALKLKDAELKTTDYSVFPVREWVKDKNVHKGFRAQMTLEVSTSEIPRLGEAMARASEAQITNVGSLETFLSVEKSQSEYLRCLDVASQDARKKADQLAKKLGFKLGEVLNVIESPKDSETPRPYPEHAMMAKADMSESAPVAVEAGTQKFSTNIQVTFEIK